MEEEMVFTLRKIQFLYFNLCPFGNLVKNIEEDIGTILFAIQLCKLSEKLENEHL